MQASIAANTYVVSGPSQTKSKATSPSQYSCIFGFSATSGQVQAPSRPAPDALDSCPVSSFTHTELQDLLPGIFNQLGPDNMNFKKVFEQVSPSSPMLAQTGFAAVRARNMHTRCS